MAAGTSVAMISAESLRGLDVPLPPLDHQRRIAEIGALSLREGAIAQRIATLRQRRTVQLLLNLANEASA
jgi:restriction endonuclease S subunit